MQSRRRGVRFCAILNVQTIRWAGIFPVNYSHDETGLQHAKFTVVFIFKRSVTNNDVTNERNDGEKKRRWKETTTKRNDDGLKYCDKSWCNVTNHSKYNAQKKQVDHERKSGLIYKVAAYAEQ